MNERYVGLKKKFMTDRRKTGVLLFLIGIGIPLILFFFQEESEFRFFSTSLVGERTLTPIEIEGIKQAIEIEKKRKSSLERAIFSIRERYRKQMGEDYFKEKWFVRRYSGFVIPYKFALALGLLFNFVGIGKFILG